MAKLVARLFSIPFKGRRAKRDDDDEEDWQDALKTTFTGGPCYTGSSTFIYNSRQCADLTEYLQQTSSSLMKQISGLDEERIRVRCEQAMKELWRDITEAKLFLQECSGTTNAYSLITKLHTREAYNVLLHNLIWSKAGLDLAIQLYDVPHLQHPIDHYNEVVEQRVRECKSLLSTYSAGAGSIILQRLKMDHEDFCSSVEHCTQKKCLDFLKKKYEAYPEESEVAADETAVQHLIDVCKVDPLDILPLQESQKLGEGGFGKVYRSSWLGQAVAVKVVGNMPEEVFTKEAQEASLLARLHSPFIVHMVGWCIKNEDCMLVTEIAQTDLHKWAIDSVTKRKLSIHAAVDIMLQIAKGMEYLHRKNIIHRDIKPSNVLLVPSSVKELADEGYARVKLCDFGLAKVKEFGAADRSRFTTLNTGTLYYRAPEVLRDDDDEGAKVKYTRKADVFSFAITCYEILEGRSAAHYYRNPVTMALLNSKALRKKMMENMRPVLPDSCPSHLAQLIQSCWDTVFQHRPSFNRISSTLTHIKFILMRVSNVERSLRPYDSVVVKPFDEIELKRLLTEDGEFEAGDGETSSCLLMTSGQSLQTHECIMCKGFKFVMQERGILVLYTPPKPAGESRALWASHTKGDEDSTCVLEEDGNLVIYGSRGRHPNNVAWSSNSTQSTRGDCKLELENEDERCHAVIRGPKGNIIWATDESVERTSMRSGQFLAASQWMLCKGSKLIMQEDGNLVLYDASSKPLWATCTIRKGAVCICRLQDDGNLVIYDTSKERDVVWSATCTQSKRGDYKLELENEDERARVVIRGPKGNIIWGTDQSVERKSVRSGQFLAAHQWMLCKGSKLIMQGDGNLVLYDAANKPLWASGTIHYQWAVCICKLEEDGNLVIYDTSSKARDVPLWSSNSTQSTRGGYELELENDDGCGRVVIRDPKGNIIWATDE